MVTLGLASRASSGQEFSTQDSFLTISGGSTKLDILTEREENRQAAFKTEHQDPGTARSKYDKYLHGKLEQLLLWQWNCSSFRKFGKTVYKQRYKVF